jgi:hypothetical protein
VGRNKAAENDEGFLQSAWEWAGDVGQAQNLGVRIVLTPTGRPGVWSVRAQAVLVVDGKAQGVHTQAKAEYPNGRATTLAALVFALLTDLSVELDKGFMTTP